ncbi:ABC transporter ATP-binding protein [Acetobacter oeni]|uniref:ABC transporter n=1 Tax=Acetobacter oeni TaxID=304077 RepID=A0A511XJU4_9PROT|nr:ABC transporter ATP-binding protein [Acetobacter oeni]MBB3883445.1 iron complex transport system ATP-binding protein [Acetobacter oeni]NHO19415.1 ATP-binding cassette domain-containing protein [Acetobacter oeni]GBR04034.1 ferrichrome ABC transporter ATP-binding protein [Acetobacter oeni LMG 21952]GEN63225.1 ABC transporter [Acetobacter oeni]
MSRETGALRASGICVRLGKLDVLKDVSLEARKGEVLGLIGPNGAGKSTFLRVMAGLRLPDTGRVTLDNVAFAAISPNRRARHIAFVPQNGGRPPPMSVYDLISLGRLPFGCDLANRAAILRAMAETGTEMLKNRPASALSGGELARVLLARALASETPYLIADEPIAALDPAHALSVMTLFRDLARKGTGVMVVLHDLTLAARFCDRVVLLDEGRIVGCGIPADIMTDAAMRAVYNVDVRRLDGAVIPWSLLRTDGDAIR